MTSVDHVELARRGYAAALSGDLTLIREMLDPDVLWHGGDPSAGCRNREQALAWMARAQQRGLGRLIDAVAAGPDRVVVVMESPEGETRANVTRFRDGRVVEMVAYPTVADARAAAGIPD